MILQALAAYYERLLADHAAQPLGFQEKEIPWVVELAPDGRFLALRPTGGEDGRGRKFVGVEIHSKDCSLIRGRLFIHFRWGCRRGAFADDK